MNYRNSYLFKIISCLLILTFSFNQSAYSEITTKHYKNLSPNSSLGDEVRADDGEAVPADLTPADLRRAAEELDLIGAQRVSGEATTTLVEITDTDFMISGIQLSQAEGGRHGAIQGGISQGGRPSRRVYSHH